MKYHEQPWHTVETLRDLARDQDAQLTEYSAKLGACDYLDRIEHTPNAWRIYGAIDQLVREGYDSDHIVAWLERGRLVAGDADTAQQENKKLCALMLDLIVLGRALLDPDDQESEAAARDVLRAAIRQARAFLQTIGFMPTGDSSHG